MKLPLAVAFACALIGRAVPCCADPVRVVHTPNGGEVPDAEVETNGAIHIAFVKGEDAFYAKSDDGGKSFSQPLRINSQPGTVHPGNMFRGPDLALGQNGRVHVIWYVNAYQRKLPQNEWGVFYSHLDPGQTTFAHEANLNHKPSDNYSLAADNGGNVSVVWMAGKLLVTESSDNGASFRGAQEIAIADPCECCASRASYSNGEVLTIAYRDKAQNVRDMHLITRIGVDGSFQKRRLSATPWPINACPMTGTFLSKQAAQTVAAWETKGDVFYARIGDNDKAPKEIKVARGKWPIALSSPDGKVLVSWKTGSTLWWQKFSSGDKAEGEVESAPSLNVNRHAGVVGKDGTFVLID